MGAIAFSRGHGDTKELRLDLDADVMRVLDALALRDDQERSKYVAELLTKHVRRECHRHTLFESMTKGNPLLVATERIPGA